MPGYVYLLEELPRTVFETGPWTKIGYSKNPPKWRVDSNLKRGNPRTLKLSAIFEFDTKEEAIKAEQATHKKFDEFLHEREWFSISWKKVARWMHRQGYHAWKDPDTN